MPLARDTIAVLVMLVAGSGAALAQTTVALPDTSQSTTVSVTVSEQARVAFPAGIAFNVTNVGRPTDAPAASVTIDRIVLASSSQLRLSLRADSASFTPPVAGATTWDASDLSWNAATWTAATGLSGALSSSAFTTVATCHAGAAACNTTALVFSLGGKSTVQRSGSHTLVVTWKVESIGS